MDETSLYQQIAETIRQDILSGKYKPGDRLPSVRNLCASWNCTPGTIQRAYSELAREGLLVSRAGRGTQVAGVVPKAKIQMQSGLRRANLVNRLEAVLLEALTAGYTLTEIQESMDLAMDHWRSIDAIKPRLDREQLLFAGSHDMLINELAHTFFSRTHDVELVMNYNGSLGGLITLAEGRADLAGSHLWDAGSDTYNLPFIRRLLPGKQVRVVTLAHRRIGLMMAPGNPLNIHQLSDLTRPKVRLINRQAGSGTRVWFDIMLKQNHIDPQTIQGYQDECSTHSEVARAIAEGTADVGIGLESAAISYHLDFIFLNRERYDLVIPDSAAQKPVIQKLIAWLASGEGKQFVEQHPGYDSQETGVIQMTTS